MNIAFVGCGFVAPYYAETLPNHPELHAVAAFDIDSSRTTAFSKRYNIPVAASYQAILDNPDISLIVNLTPAAAHVEVTRAALLAGKHVYSEEPLSLDPAGARELIDLAKKMDRLLSVAPCNFLGGSMQTLARLVREKVVGTPRVVYAELDDGPIHKLAYDTWTSGTGVPWPADSEFRVGCVWQHAAYEVGFLTSTFGPAESVTSISHTLITDKKKDLTAEELGPDFCVALIPFKSGVVARLTIGTVAKRNRSMTITGDDGILHVPEIWDYEAPIQFTLSRGTTEMPESSTLHVKHTNGTNGTSNGTNGTSNGTPETPEKQLPTGDRGIQVDMPTNIKRHYPNAYNMNMCLGLADLAAAIKEKRRPRMPADHAFHVYEILQALDDSIKEPGRRVITSIFEPIEPMPALETTAKDCKITW